MRFPTKILVFLFLFTSLAATLQETENQNVVKWESHKKLTWDDFQGIVNYNSKHTAESGIEIIYESSYMSDTTVGFKVSCIFYKEISWVQRMRANSNLLVHEQGHFDLAYYYSKKLELKLKQLEKVNYILHSVEVNASVNTIYDEIVQERSNLDSLYDKETNYSMNHKKQIQWNQKLNKLIESYK
jgi:hypothetical protein